MSYPINVNIPAANNDPQDDQPIMQQNYANIASFLAVDHIPAGAIGNGFHEQVTYYTENTPVTPTDPTSVGFTANAATLPSTTSSASTIAQSFFANQNGVFPRSAIRAFGVFASSVAPVTTLLNAFNVASISGSSAVYIITLTTNSTSGNNVVVFTNAAGTTTKPSYTFVGGVLTLSSVTVGTNISFLVLQI